MLVERLKKFLLLIFKRGKKMTRNFSTWLASFKSSIATYSYYVDFPKIYQNIDAIKVELNILNSLIGSDNIKSDFDQIVTKYPETLKCIPLLLAIRGREIEITDEKGSFVYKFDGSESVSVDKYVEFMTKSGLFELLQKHLISNLVDYATGVETGLDSNGRKSRGGQLMEDLVEYYLKKAGFSKENTSLAYYPEMSISKIQKKWDIDLSSISNGGKTEKRFDFVVKTPTMIYGIETNFYATGGSKLNETARSYKNLASESKNISGFSFVWFTDGKGWVSARHNLEETFDAMPHIYNIKDMEDGIMKTLFK